MRQLWLSLILCVFLPTLVCKADTTAFDQLPNQHLPQNLLKESNDPADTSEIRYGFSSLVFTSGPVQEVKIVRQTSPEETNVFSLVKTAEAVGMPTGLTPQYFETIGNSVNRVSQLGDLRSVLSQNNFQALEDKVKSGASQYAVLTMVQTMRPYDIRVMDFDIRKNEATLAVKGQSHLGPMRGLIHLVKQGDLWKIDKENWYAGGRDVQDYLGAFLNPLPAKNKYNDAESTGLMSQISPDYKTNRNFLSLTKVPYHKSRRAFTFVFLLNKENRNKSHTHMHVLWTGSKKILREQKVVDNQYPIDFSIANFDEGYSARQWNLILPNKKPREVVVSVLWNF